MTKHLKEWKIYGKRWKRFFVIFAATIPVVILAALITESLMIDHLSVVSFVMGLWGAIDYGFLDTCDMVAMPKMQ